MQNLILFHQNNPYSLASFSGKVKGDFCGYFQEAPGVQEGKHAVFACVIDDALKGILADKPIEKVGSIFVPQDRLENLGIDRIHTIGTPYSLEVSKGELIAAEDLSKEFVQGYMEKYGPKIRGSQIREYVGDKWYTFPRVMSKRPDQIAETCSYLLNDSVFYEAVKSDNVKKCVFVAGIAGSGKSHLLENSEYGKKISDDPGILLLENCNFDDADLAKIQTGLRLGKDVENLWIHCPPRLAAKGTMLRDEGSNRILGGMTSTEKFVKRHAAIADNFVQLCEGTLFKGSDRLICAAFDNSDRQTGRPLPQSKEELFQFQGDAAKEFAKQKVCRSDDIQAVVQEVDQVILDTCEERRKKGKPVTLRSGLLSSHQYIARE